MYASRTFCCNGQRCDTPQICGRHDKKKVSRMRHLKISGSAPPISVDIEEA